MLDLIDFPRFSGVLKRWIAKKWLVFIATMGEHNWLSKVDVSCFHLLHCVHDVYQNCCRTSPETLGNWNDYHPRLISYSISLFR